MIDKQKYEHEIHEQSDDELFNETVMQITTGSMSVDGYNGHKTMINLCFKEWEKRDKKNKYHMASKEAGRKLGFK